MRLTKEGLIEKFKNYAGEDVTSDAAIELLEDISDSVGVETEEGEGGEDWETKYKELEDWETKYKELDESWRKKYAERFSEPGEKEKEPEEEKEEEEEEEEETEETEEERAENVTYEDLFEEKKKKED